MGEYRSFNKVIEESIVKHWERPAFTELGGKSLKYGDVAQHIEKLHILFEASGLRVGDKVSLCARNQANWAVAFMAVITYGAVPVPILHEFKPANVHHIVNHSESKLFFAGDAVWKNLDASQMPQLKAIIGLTSFEKLVCKDEKIEECLNNIDSLFDEKFSTGFKPSDISYYVEESGDQLAMINYTSGTSGFSKGVMIPYRALMGNVQFAQRTYSNVGCDANVVSMLPMAHMYGLMFEFLYEFSIGAQINFLTRLPSPRIIMEAFASVKPDIVVSVPMIIEKIYKYKITPLLQTRKMKLLLALPIVSSKVRQRINDELISTFGGKFQEIIIGGAAFNKEADDFFHKINFKYTIGYGMTECAPIVTYAHWYETRPGSCGKVVCELQARIDSSNPEMIPGEILLKGQNVMLGYYKNPEATAASFTEDGWLKTGDMGVMDKDGYLYIKGRCKSMLLGPSGQNIYPEEIECEINSMPVVSESLVVEEDGKLVALIYPNMEQVEAESLSEDDVRNLLQEAVDLVNSNMPNYSKIDSFRVMKEDFERTPKRSIKRFLYQK